MTISRMPSVTARLRLNQALILVAASYIAICFAPWPWPLAYLGFWAGVPFGMLFEAIQQRSERRARRG
jgi:hypothetical protein